MATGLGFGVDVSLKVLVLLAGAGVGCVLLGRASAAVRHGVWTLAVGGALALPGLAWLLPSWPVSWLPGWSGPVAEGTAAATVASERVVAAGPAGQEAVSARVGGPEEGAVAVGGPGGGAATTAGWTTARWLQGVWLAGALVVIGPLLAGAWAMRRLWARARPVNDDVWAAEVVESCDALGLKASVRLRQSERIRVPMVWGLRRPVVLLPEAAEQWPAERRRMVLLHELAHVKRWDGLTQTLARCACALFWFNPLVWLAGWRMRVERERACDDLVLRAGSKPSRYADELLQITAGLRGRSLAAGAAIAMARHSTLEGRLLAILDPARNRQALSRWTALAGVALWTGIIGPVAMLRGADRSELPTPRSRHFVRVVVVQQTNLTFQGEATTWEKLPDQLAEVADRDRTVLELATDSDQATLAQFQPIQGRIAALSQEYGFEYLSLIGVHPPGSKGSPTQRIGRQKSTAGEMATPITVKVTKQAPWLRFGSEAVTAGELRDRLKEAATRNPGALVLIQAESGAASEQVSRVIEAAEAVGLTRVSLTRSSLRTEAPAGKPPVSPARPAGDWQARLNEDQRAVVEWTDRQFRGFLDYRRPEDFPEAERADLEARLLRALKGPQNREYFEAINTLGAMGARQAVAALAEIAFDRREKNNRDRWMATRALGLIGDPSVVPQMIHLIYLSNPNTRWWSQISLVRLTGQNFGTDWQAWGRWWNEQKKQPAFDDQPIAWSANPEWSKPEALVEGDRKFIGELKAGPARGDRPSRDPAATPSGGASADSVSNTVRQAVMTISTCAESDPRIKTVMKPLETLEARQVMEAVAPYLDSKEDTVRRAAIYVTWQGTCEALEPAAAGLKKLCGHEEDLTRGMAALALGGKKVAGSFVPLATMATNDPSGYARRCAAYALGTLGQPEAKPVLEQALKDKDRLVRNNAEAALRMLGGK